MDVRFHYKSLCSVLVKKTSRFAVLGVFFSTTACMHYASLPPLVQQGAENSLLITQARVFDGNANHPVAENMDLLIEDGVIVRIAPHPLDVEAGTVIPADGRLVMPGLIDFHTHVGGTDSPPWRPTFYPPERTLSAFLAYGVTSVVDMGGAPGQLKDLHEELASGDIAGPRLAYAGRQVTVAGSHPGPMLEESLRWPVSSIAKYLMVDEIDETSDLDALIASRREDGASLVKIMIDRIPLDTASMPVALARKVVETAHLDSMKVAAHVGTEQDLETGLAADVDLFAHSVNNSPLSDAAVAKLKMAETPVISTLRVFQNIALVSTGANPVTDADASIMDADVVEAFNPPRRRLAGHAQIRSPCRRTHRGNVRRLPQTAGGWRSHTAGHRHADSRRFGGILHPFRTGDAG